MIHDHVPISPTGHMTVSDAFSSMIEHRSATNQATTPHRSCVANWYEFVKPHPPCVHHTDSKQCVATKHTLLNHELLVKYDMCRYAGAHWEKQYATTPKNFLTEDTEWILGDERVVMSTITYKGKILKKIEKTKQENGKEVKVIEEKQVGSITAQRSGKFFPGDRVLPPEHLNDFNEYVIKMVNEKQKTLDVKNENTKKTFRQDEARLPAFFIGDIVNIENSDKSCTITKHISKKKVKIQEKLGNVIIDTKDVNTDELKLKYRPNEKVQNLSVSYDDDPDKKIHAWIKHGEQSKLYISSKDGHQEYKRVSHSEFGLPTLVSTLGRTTTRTISRVQEETEISHKQRHALYVFWASRCVPWRKLSQ